MPSFPKRHWRPLLVVFVLSPSIFFASSYAAGTASGNHTDRYSASPGPWNVNMTVSHPAYLVSGQQVAVTLSIGVNTPDGNYSVEVNDVGVELRQPTTVNTTSNIVTSWAVLGSAHLNINQNISGPRYVTRAVTVVATSPPASGAGDLLTPSSSVAFNGVVNLTVFQKQGNETFASPQTISLLDSETYYQNELSTLASTSSWVTYQLLAAVAGLVLFVRYRPAPTGGPMDSYSVGLRSYRLERAQARLEGMLKSGTIGRERYEELKEGFMRELDKIKSGEPRS